MKKKLLVLFFLFSLNFSSNVIDINYKESRVIRIPKIKDIIVFENSSNIKVQINDEGIVLIEGINPGKSKFIAVKDNNKDIYVINVKPKNLSLGARIPNVDYTGDKFVAHFNAGYGYGESRSDFAENNWNYNYMYYKLETKGPTELGAFYSRIGIKNKPEIQGVYEFNVRLDSEIGIFEIGDQYLSNKSTIVMPSQPLQGFSWSNKNINWNAYLFYGRNNFGYWGNVLNREDMRGNEDLSYAKLVYSFDRDNNLGVNVSNKSTSVLYDWNNRNLQVYGEIGRDYNDKSGQDFKIAYNSRNGLNSSIRYLSIDENFQTPFGIENYSGYTGFQYNLFYRPEYLWDVLYNGEIFQKLINSDSLDNQRDFLRANYRASSLHELMPDLMFDFSKYIGESYDATSDNYKYKNESIQLKLTKETNIFSLPLSLWYRFKPYSYQNYKSSINDYNRLQNSIGFKVPLISPFTFQSEVSLFNYTYNNVSSQNYNSFEWDNFLVMNPIFIAEDMSIDAFYQIKTRYLEKDSFNLWQKGNKLMHYFMFQYIYYPNPDGRLAIRAYRRLMDENDELRVDAVIDELRIEYSQNFNIDVRLGGGKSVITGLVYNDNNMNGLYDQGEDGVDGVVVKLSSGQQTTTNRLGVYTFRDIPAGDYDVFIEKPDSQLIFTEDHPKRIIIDKSNRIIANFGVLVSGRVHGRVYVDVNSNSFFDAGDKVVENARVFINDQVVNTSYEGLYSISADDFSEYKVQVDVSSVPFSFSLTSSRIVNIYGKGLIDFVFKPRTNIQALDNQIIIDEIKDIDNQVFVKGKADNNVVSFFVNNIRVEIKNNTFEVTVPKIAPTLKVKIFTSDNRSYIQNIEYQ
jgi:hypothetical protein